VVEQCVAICVIPVKCIYFNAPCVKLQRPFNPQKQHISVPGKYFFISTRRACGSQGIRREV
jgi:hypothetical protein